METRAFGGTDVGLRRSNNEDRFLVDRSLGLYIVADGMGGHAAGEMASAMAVEHIRTCVREQAPLLEEMTTHPTAELRSKIEQLLTKAVESASTAVFQRAQAELQKKGMATTASVLLVTGKRAFIAHVGDSRIYLIRRGEVHQLTEDHTFVAAQLKAGAITAEEAARSPYANVITRAVGMQELVQVDVTSLDALANDVFLLSSDGLHDYVQPGEILERLKPAIGDDRVQSLIDLAKERGGNDNITCILVSPTGAGEKTSNEVLLKIDTLAAIPLFKNLDYRELVEILNITRVRSYEPRDMAITEGEAGQEFFAILAGEAEVVNGGVVIGKLGPGAHFGEMALVDRSPRSATIRATTPLRAMVIDRADFYEIIRRGQPLAVKLLWALVRGLSVQLRDRTRHAVDAMSGTATGTVVDLEEIGAEKAG